MPLEFFNVARGVLEHDEAACRGVVAGRSAPLCAPGTTRDHAVAPCACGWGCTTCPVVVGVAHSTSGIFVERRLAYAVGPGVGPFATLAALSRKPNFLVSKALKQHITHRLALNYGQATLGATKAARSSNRHGLIAGARHR